MKKLIPIFFVMLLSLSVVSVAGYGYSDCPPAQKTYYQTEVSYGGCRFCQIVKPLFIKEQVPEVVRVQERVSACKSCQVMKPLVIKESHPDYIYQQRSISGCVDCKTSGGSEYNAYDYDYGKMNKNEYDNVAYTNTDVSYTINDDY